MIEIIEEANGEFATIKIVCSICKKEERERWHKTTDGNPGAMKLDQLSPPGWSFPVGIHGEENSPICPVCTKKLLKETAKEGEDRDPSDTDFYRWQTEHICFHCVHSLLCKFSPDDDDELCVTITACRAFSQRSEETTEEKENS